MARPGRRHLRRPRDAPDRRARRARARGGGRRDLPAAAQGRPRHGTRVFAVAPFATRGLAKLHGHAGADRPRRRGRRARGAARRRRARRRQRRRCVLVGERLATVPGALTAAAGSAAQAPVPGWPGCRAAPVTAARSRPAACPACCPAAARSPTPPRASTSPPPGASTACPRRAGRDADGDPGRAGRRRARRPRGRRRRPRRPADPAADPRRDRGRAVRGQPRARARPRSPGPPTSCFPVAPVAEKAGTFVDLGGPRRGRSTRCFASPSLAARRAGARRHRRGAGRRRSASAPSPTRAPQLAELGPWDGARAALDRGRGQPRGRRRRRAGCSRPGSCCSTTARCRTATRPTSRTGRARGRPAAPRRRRRRCGADRHRHRDRGSVTLPAVVADLRRRRGLAAGQLAGRGVLRRPGLARQPGRPSKGARR